MSILSKFYANLMSILGQNVITKLYFLLTWVWGPPFFWTMLKNCRGTSLSYKAMSYKQFLCKMTFYCTKIQYGVRSRHWRVTATQLWLLYFQSLGFSTFDQIWRHMIISEQSGDLRSHLKTHSGGNSICGKMWKRIRFDQWKCACLWEVDKMKIRIF